MSTTGNWESIAIEQATSGADNSKNADHPRVNAWRLAKRFSLDDTGKHVLNVGLANFERHYRYRGMTAAAFAKNTARWMSDSKLLAPHVNFTVFEAAICEYASELLDTSPRID